MPSARQLRLAAATNTPLDTVGQVWETGSISPAASPAGKLVKPGDMKLPVISLDAKGDILIAVDREGRRGTGQ